jgi:hypothetical protein
MPSSVRAGNANRLEHRDPLDRHVRVGILLSMATGIPRATRGGLRTDVQSKTCPRSGVTEPVAATRPNGEWLVDDPSLEPCD